MEEGDCCDIVELLSQVKRDFLVRNNGDEVKIESLRGKTICIFFVSLRKKCRYAGPCMVLEEVYQELYPKGEFEVVFVAETEDGGASQKMRKQEIEVEELFNNIFSKMPWLSIPFTDVEKRNQLCDLLYLPAVWGPNSVILDPKGKVLSTCGNIILEDYGAEGYPFTDERIKEIVEEDQAVQAKLGLKTFLNSCSGPFAIRNYSKRVPISDEGIKEIEEEDEAVRENLFLKTLLFSSTCDFVITNKFDKVPISDLEGKVVGLYMYGGEPTIMQKLVEAYQELQKREEKFEIVLINLHFYGGYSDKNSFQKNFERMPWLALPFMDKRIRKVWRIFDRPGVGFNQEGILIIIGPNGKFVETYGSTILEYYGSDGYPFTKQKAVETEKIRKKEVTLESLLAKADKDYVIKRDGTEVIFFSSACLLASAVSSRKELTSEIPFSDLKGKSVLLFFPDESSDHFCEVVSKLKEWYEEIKGRDEKFEVIMVSSAESKTSFDNFFSEMPWLAFPYDVHLQSVFLRILGSCSPDLVAFGTDGHLVTTEALQRLQNQGASAYPFTYDKSLLDEEIYQELELRLCWTC